MRRGLGHGALGLAHETRARHLVSICCHCSLDALVYSGPALCRITAQVTGSAAIPPVFQPRSAFFNKSPTSLPRSILPRSHDIIGCESHPLLSYHLGQLPLENRVSGKGMGAVMVTSTLQMIHQQPNPGVHYEYVIRDANTISPQVPPLRRPGESHLASPSLSSPPPHASPLVCAQCV